ncbi:MAG: HNH endonuclease [Caulobacteraceae bacterium]
MARKPSAPAKPAAAPKTPAGRLLPGSGARGGGSPPRRRSSAGRVAAAALGLASAAGVGAGLWSDQASQPPSGRILPEASITPGVTDPAVTDSVELCKHQWAQGQPGLPPVKGGTLTYSQAARHTSEGLKNQVFADYGLKNPKDGGKSYEIDHLVPLSLGGRDVEKNLWPQTRSTALEMNAWLKDKLETRLYNILCNHKPDDPAVTVQEAQTALRTDWTQAYQRFCAAGETCDQSETD